MDENGLHKIIVDEIYKSPVVEKEKEAVDRLLNDIGPKYAELKNACEKSDTTERNAAVEIWFKKINVYEFVKEKGATF